MKRRCQHSIQNKSTVLTPKTFSPTVLARGTILYGGPACTAQLYYGAGLVSGILRGAGTVSQFRPRWFYLLDGLRRRARRVSSSACHQFMIRLVNRDACGRDQNFTPELYYIPCTLLNLLTDLTLSLYTYDDMCGIRIRPRAGRAPARDVAIATRAHFGLHVSCAFRVSAEGERYRQHVKIYMHVYFNE